MCIKNNEGPIDFVVPWVDDTDPAWQRSRALHGRAITSTSDSRDIRFRDWGLFKYWFRGVAEFAPWVNKIHLITSGHLPNWLNRDHPKINIVRHDQYIPDRYLPTFSSHTIELNMHRISGLAEKFVYFNDDLFIINTVSPQTFFTKNLPNDSAVLDALDGGGFKLILINDIRIINSFHSKRDAMRQSLLNWINLKYGPNLIRNLLLLPWSKYTGFYNFHLPNSFLKSTLLDVWSHAEKEVDATCVRKFRSDMDVNQYLFRYWQLANNKFHPVSKHRLGDFLRVGVDPMERVLDILKRSRKKFVCINDHATDINSDMISAISIALNKRFPVKSLFEL